jgi:hypothetical protein
MPSRSAAAFRASVRDRLKTEAKKCGRPVKELQREFVLQRAAMAAGRTRERTYLGARYARLVPRLGKQKTIVAVEHSILIAVWHMLTDNVDYQDLGGDYFTKQDPERAMRRIMRQANVLGLTVRFDPIPDVAYEGREFIFG